MTFKLLFFLCAPGQARLCVGFSVLSLPTAGCHIGGGAPIERQSVSSLLLVCMWSIYYLLCRSCSFSPQLFFRRNCSWCWCKFGVSMGADEFRIDPAQILAGCWPPFLGGRPERAEPQPTSNSNSHHLFVPSISPTHASGFIYLISNCSNNT